MGYDIQVADLQEQHTAVVTGHADENGIPEFLGHAFPSVMRVIEEQGLSPVGVPFGRYRPTEDGGFDIEAGIAASGPVTASEDVEPGGLPGGRTARTVHVGHWSELDAAYRALVEWAVDNGYAPSSAPWESYLDGPEAAEPRTEVFLPLQDVAHRNG